MGARYSHLTLAERVKIQRWRRAKVSVNRMASALGRHRSTIFRELKRNHFEEKELPDVVGYFGVAAQQDALSRGASQRKLIRFGALCDTIVELILESWVTCSP